MPSMCKNCKRKAELHSGIKNGVLYDGLCERCVGVIESAEFSRQHDRQFQRRHYAKDLVQPSERDYAKIYGEEAARKKGWTDADLRRHG